MAVSITSVGEKAKVKSEEEVKEEEQESVNIKTEPDEVRDIQCSKFTRVKSNKKKSVFSSLIAKKDSRNGEKKMYKKAHFILSHNI